MRGQLFVSTACLPGEVPLLERLETYREHGLRFIELGAGVVVHEEDLVGVRRHLDGGFLVHNYFPPPADPFVLNLASSEEATRDASIALAIEAMRLCANLEAPFYSVHAGFVVDPRAFARGRFQFPDVSSDRAREEAMVRFFSAVEALLEYADRFDIDLLIENNCCYEGLEDRLLFYGGDELTRLMEFQHPRLGVLLDTGHLSVSASTLGLTASDLLGDAHDLVRGVHLHENDGLRDEHRPISIDGWALEYLERSRWTREPILVVEAKFDALSELAAHVEWLSGRLRQANWTSAALHQDGSDG